MGVGRDVPGNANPLDDRLAAPKLGDRLAPKLGARLAAAILDGRLATPKFGDRIAAPILGIRLAAAGSVVWGDGLSPTPDDAGLQIDGDAICG